MKKCTLKIALFKRTGLLCFLIFLSTYGLSARIRPDQEAPLPRISIQVKDKPLKEVLAMLEKASGFRFVYNEALVTGYPAVYLQARGEELDHVMKKLLHATDLDFISRENSIVLMKKSSKKQPVARTKEVMAEQEREIRGAVKDEQGNPLAGVSVKVKGSNQGAATDEKGLFVLKLNRGDSVLICSFMGFQTQEVPLTEKNSVNIILVSVDNALDEVVVIGYGTQRKGDVTSSVATVKAEDFVKGPVQDAGQLLQGKVAGLTVSMPSGNPTANTQILLRGNTTLFGANSNPLVLIDGIPGNLNTVAPEDIESLDVLKDGSAAAIYGVRGTNGVILVTTKRASGDYTNVVEYSSSLSTQQMFRQLKMLTAEDYRQQIAAGIREAQYDLGENTDWMKEITRTPLSQIHNLTFRGGNNRTNYIASVNYRGLNGVMKRSDNNTLTARAEINHSMFDDKLRINFGVLNQQNQYTLTLDNTEAQDGQSFNGYTYRQALIRNPTSPIYDSDGNWFEQTGIFNYENPLSRLYESDGENKRSNTRINSNISYLPIQKLKFNALLSYQRTNQNLGYSETKKHISTLRDGLNGYAAIGSSFTNDKLLEITGEYSDTFGDHQLKVLAGYSYQEVDNESNFMRNRDFPTDEFSYHNIGLGRALAEGLGAIGSNKNLSNLIGFFGRASYNYKDRYLVMASLRKEAASQLYGAEQPWGTFPAVSLGWRLTQEPFMANQKIFDDIKFRAGYGVTGSQPAAGFLGVALLGYGNYVYSNGKWIQSLVPSQNPNPYLRWEEKHELNIGLDFTIARSRVSGTVDYYDRQIKGLLYDYQVPSPPNLYPSTRANVGDMSNKGLEVQVNWVAIKNDNFSWTTTFNFSTNTNKLKSLSNELYQQTTDYFTVGDAGEPVQTFTHLVRVGGNIGDFYGFKVVDIDADGRWIYEGRDGTPVSYEEFNRAFEDKRVLGNGLPKYYGGWNNNFRYKNIDLSITMRGAFGYEVLNAQRMFHETTNTQYYNVLKSSYDPVFGKAVLNADVPLEFNSYYVEKGDFWKIDNITLGYNFNQLKSKVIRSLRIYASTINTFIITGYKGMDPEVNRLGLDPGVDTRDKYPTVRTFTFGVNASF